MSCVSRGGLLVGSRSGSRYPNYTGVSKNNVLNRECRTAIFIAEGTNRQTDRRRLPKGKGAPGNILMIRF